MEAGAAADGDLVGGAGGALAGLSGAGRLQQAEGDLVEGGLDREVDRVGAPGALFVAEVGAHSREAIRQEGEGVVDQLTGGVDDFPLDHEATHRIDRLRGQPEVAHDRYARRRDRPLRRCS